MSETNSRIMVILVATALAVGTMFLFYPGLMSYDSIFMYRQVIGDMPVGNYHPPVMVYAWQLGHFVIGAGSMLIFHQLMYWSAIATIAICVQDRLWARLLVVTIVGLLPPLWIHSAIIWNDVGVMSSFLLAIACTLVLKRTGARWVYFLGILALFYGMAARPTALLAAIPLLYILCDAFFNSGSRQGRWSKIALLASVLWLSGLTVVYMIGAIGVEQNTKWPTIAVWDLGAVSIAEQKVLIPAAILFQRNKSETENLALLKEAFDPEVNGPLANVANFFPQPEHHQELFKAWLNLPVEYPVSYFKHRVQVFAHLLGFGSGEIHLAFEHRVIENDFGLKLLNQDSKVFDKSIQWVALSTNTLVYRPWVYLLILVLILASASYRLRHNNLFGSRLLVSMGFSGLLYVLPLLIVAPATDFRYVLWMVACSSVMFCFIFRVPEPQ